MLESDPSVFQEELPNHHFRTELPNLIRDLGLDPYDLTVYFFIKSICGGSNKCWYSIPTLAKYIGISESKLKESLKNLIEGKNKLKLKLIQKTTRKNLHKNFNETNIYTVLDIWEQNGKFYRKTHYKDTIEKNQPWGGSPKNPGVGRQKTQGGAPKNPKEETLKKVLVEEEGASSRPAASLFSPCYFNEESKKFDWLPTGFVEELQACFPKINVLEQLKVAALKAQTVKNKKGKDWRKYLIAWMENAQKYSDKYQKEPEKEKENYVEKNLKVLEELTKKWHNPLEKICNDGSIVWIQNGKKRRGYTPLDTPSFELEFIKILKMYDFKRNVGK